MISPSRYFFGLLYQKVTSKIDESLKASLKLVLFRSFYFIIILSRHIILTLMFLQFYVFAICVFLINFNKCCLISLDFDVALFSSFLIFCYYFTLLISRKIGQEHMKNSKNIGYIVLRTVQ